METEERLKALEDEFHKTKSETKQLMLDIRALLMEASSPIKSQPENGKGSGQAADKNG
jgi:hypothetical protein